MASWPLASLRRLPRLLLATRRLRVPRRRHLLRQPPAPGAPRAKRHGGRTRTFRRRRPRAVGARSSSPIRR
eukprot:7129935-Alexandrium_andersonii.AAC.1